MIYNLYSVCLGIGKEGTECTWECRDIERRDVWRLWSDQ